MTATNSNGSPAVKPKRNTKKSKSAKSQKIADATVASPPTEGPSTPPKTSATSDGAAEKVPKKRRKATKRPPAPPVDADGAKSGPALADPATSKPLGAGIAPIEPRNGTDPADIAILDPSETLDPDVMLEAGRTLQLGQTLELDEPLGLDEPLELGEPLTFGEPLELREPLEPDQTLELDGTLHLDIAQSQLGVSDTDSDAPETILQVGTVVADRTKESRWSARDRVREQELLALLADLPQGDPLRAAARDELVTMHMPLAAFLARRFRDRGEPLDDLTQVATVGLIKAVDRFEPDRGVEFSTFATPTIVGEIKRHFRDKGWAIRVPRRLQELRLAITRATAELSQQTGTSPTVAQLATHLGISEDEVLEGLESAAAYATVSLDSTTSDGSQEGGASIAETMGEHDPSLAEVEHRATLHPLLAKLGEREQRIVYMRFFENKTQAQIASEIGVSQMHISRLLSKSLAQMRAGMTPLD